MTLEYKIVKEIEENLHVESQVLSFLLCGSNTGMDTLLTQVAQRTGLGFRTLPASNILREWVNCRNNDIAKLFETSAPCITMVFGCDELFTER